MNQTLKLHNRHNDEWLHMTRGVKDGREVLFIEGGLPPHSDGPPMHVHVDQDECIEVVSGRVSAMATRYKLSAVRPMSQPGKRCRSQQSVLLYTIKTALLLKSAKVKSAMWKATA